MWRIKVKNNLRPTGSRGRAVHVGERELRERVELEQRLDEAGLAGAIGTDEEVKRRESELGATERFKIAERDGRDHAVTVSARAHDDKVIRVEPAAHAVARVENFAEC